jgi:CPA1 family monovalent cation:H+ antiporter
VERLRRLAELRTHIAWEGLATDMAVTPSATYRRLRAEMIRAERDVLVRLRDAGELDDEVLRRVQQELDLEDSMLAQADDAAPDHEGMLEDLIPGGTSTCEHLRTATGVDAEPLPGAGCEECLALGWTWVHLRRCLTCGHVGCCDSSKGRHARVHYHETAHPVMRSIEPGEAWRWCFVDRVVG